VRSWLGCIVAAGLLAASLPSVAAEGIYMCIDGKGRRLTSDRPILDCIDREQTELSPSGKVVRKIGPSPTADEVAAEEERLRKAQEERNRAEEDKRRDRVLLTRYPDKATHDKERNAALATVDEVIATANRRTSELHWQRKKLDGELEFYGGDMKKVPAALKRQIDGNEQQAAAQRRFIAAQQEEKRRINARYDEELKRLNGLWTQRATAAMPAVSRSSSSAGR
jgi:hypothetical protein